MTPVIPTIAALSLALLGQQQQVPSKRGMQADDRFRFIDAGSPSISPDGRWVLSTRARLTLEDNRRHVTTWLAPARAGATSRQFLHEGDRAISWARDSRAVFFLRQQAVFVQGIDDTIPRQVGNLGSDPGYNWQIARDGSFFLLARAESLPKAPGAEAGVVFVYEGSNGQTSDVWSNLWRFDVRSGVLSRLTDRDWSISSADLAPDGRSAVVAARPDNERNTRWKSELYIVDLTTGAVRQLTENQAPEADPQWFPDGKSVLFGAVRLDRWENGQVDLWRLDVATGTVRNITPNHTGWFVQPVIAPDGKTIFVSSGYGTTRFPVRIDVASGMITQLLRTRGAASVGSWSDDRRTYAYLYQDGTTPPDVYVGGIDVSAERQQRITDLNPWIPRGIALGSVQRVEWHSTGGLRIEGLLTLPPSGARQPVRLPLIVHVPCGPGCGWKNVFSLKNQMYAALGYAQLSVLVRGSSNYDDAFLRANQFDIGGGDLADLLTGIDTMVARGIAHPDSLAIDGWSYGAVLGGYALTKTTRFKAASIGAMVSDWISDYGASVNYDLVRWFIGGTPWSNPEQWRERASLTHADRVRTPTLLHHGDEDRTSWPFHSMNYFAALRDAGTPTRLIRYSSEPHDFQQPRSLRIRDVEDLAWMQRFVRGVTP
jgi:dipeptidyl aminopeptidase/acylaminoacyl peptidase